MHGFWLFLHMTGVLAFVLGHGVSAGASFKIRGERDAARIGALLDLSSSSLWLTYVGLLLLIASGVVLGFIDDAWGEAWIWIALGLLIAIVVAMYPLGSAHYNRVREAVGAQTYDQRRKGIEPGPPASAEEIARIVSSTRPFAVAAVGGGGLLVILWLMIVQPF